MKIQVKVHTNAKKNEVKQVDKDIFEVYTTNTPENLKANKSVIELLSKFLRIGKTKFKILKGERNKFKIIEIIND